jgi:hypothetical protein
MSSRCRVHSRLHHLQLLAARSVGLESREHNRPRDTTAARTATEFAFRLRDPDPEEISALRWINRRLTWEDRLADLHARAGIETNAGANDRRCRVGA